MKYAWFDVTRNAGIARIMHMSYRSKAYTWNDIILVKRSMNLFFFFLNTILAGRFLLVCRRNILSRNRESSIFSEMAPLSRPHGGAITLNTVVQGFESQGIYHCLVSGMPHLLHGTRWRCCSLIPHPFDCGVCEILNQHNSGDCSRIRVIEELSISSYWGCESRTCSLLMSWTCCHGSDTVVHCWRLGTLVMGVAHMFIATAFEHWSRCGTHVHCYCLWTLV